MQLSDPSYYDVNNMYKEARDKFLQWYEIHWQDPFNMDRELLEYCHSDVDMLLNVCWKFRKLFMDITNPITPLIPLIISPLPHYAWEPSVLNFYSKNGLYCTRRMHGTSACTGYGTANVHGSRPENCTEMHPSKSTWEMVAGHKWTGRRLSPTGLSSLP